MMTIYISSRVFLRRFKRERKGNSILFPLGYGPFFFVLFGKKGIWRDSIHELIQCSMSKSPGMKVEDMLKDEWWKTPLKKKEWIQKIIETWLSLKGEWWVDGLILTTVDETRYHTHFHTIYQSKPTLFLSLFTLTQHALAWGHSAIVPTSLFGDCVVGTLSVGMLTEAHIIDCE